MELDILSSNLTPSIILECFRWHMSSWLSKASVNASLPPLYSKIGTIKALYNLIFILIVCLSLLVLFHSLDRSWKREFGSIRSLCYVFSISYFKSKHTHVLGIVHPSVYYEMCLLFCRNIKIFSLGVNSKCIDYRINFSLLYTNSVCLYRSVLTKVNVICILHLSVRFLRSWPCR